MLTYFTRVHSKYNRDVASIAVFADNNSDWRPNQYHRKIWNSAITRSYEVIKIIDFKGKEEFLQKTDNPFGLLVLAQLAEIDTRPNQEARLVSKTYLVKYLLQHDWSISARLEHR